MNCNTTHYRANSSSVPGDPTAVAIGEGKRWELGAVGRGAARLFSPPLVPQRIEGRDYLMLDMGRPGVRFPWPRGGLMMLYGRDVALDRRLLVGFARDVSAVSDDEYKRLAAPAVLQRFPMDLANPDLEFSGLYEDGWTSEHMFASLAPTGAGSNGPGAKAVVARGSVPEIGGDKTFRTVATLLVDGTEIARQDLGTGPFELRGLVPPTSLAADASAPVADAGRRRVELRFSKWQSLPDGDRRPVAARLTLLGFVNATPADHGLARQ